MENVSIEKCIAQVPNRFELVVLAVGRAKALGLGAPSLVEQENDKSTVVALREIEAEKLNLEQLKDGLVDKLQRFAVQKEQEADDEELKAIDAEIMGDAIFSDTEIQEVGSFQVVDEV